MVRTDVMVAGLGGMGGHVLENVVREPTVSKIVAVDVDEGYGIQKTYTAMLGANHLGLYPDVKFYKMDLYEDVGKNAELIKRVNPRVIISNVAMISPGGRRKVLPPEVNDKLHSDFVEGPWLPLQLRLPYRLMRAVKAANIDTYVVNVSYPDAVGPALKTQGLAPTVGFGNIDNVAVMIRQEVAEREGVKAHSVMPFLVAHHFVNVWLVWGKPDPDKFCPYFLKIFVDSRDVTSKYDTNELMKTCREGNKQLGFGGPNYVAIGASGVKNALALIQDRQILTHAPSPNGMVGGYPVRLGADGAKVVLPEGITEKEALKINLEGQRRDGIEEIRDDGTVIFPDRAVEKIYEILNFRLKSFKVNEVDEVAEDLWGKLRELAKKRGYWDRA